MSRLLVNHSLFAGWLARYSDHQHPLERHGGSPPPRGPPDPLARKGGNDHEQRRLLGIFNFCLILRLPLENRRPCSKST